MKIERKAYAKINLGLDVTGVREDGYHIVKMIMQNVDLYDTLTFEDNDSGEIVLTASTDKIETDERNLICKVARQLKDKFNVKQGVTMHLVKRIPVAAGMAGGSTDGAAAYLALNELWGLNLSKKELCELAVSLGADIPYCIIGGTALAEGIGEELTAISDMPTCHLVIAKPAIDVSTGWVYKELDSREGIKHPDIDGVKAAIEEGDLNKMCALIGKEGAVGAFMTGSGPTVFGVFDKKDAAEAGYRAVVESKLAPETFLSAPINPGKED